MQLIPTTTTDHIDEQIDVASYDHVLVMFSGGKDSLACVLHLIDQGVPRDKIELWHHDVDGAEGSTLMDWPVTRDYCRKVADALGLPILFSWKEGGFEGEMLRDEQPTGRTWYETPDGTYHSGGKGPAGTRQKFPQVSADLKVRWCSAYLKIDVAATAIRNQSRFNDRRTLVVTGERAEESAARSRYKTFEPHRSHSNKRHVDQWRPLHQWPERRVWEIIERHSINPHPAYHLGWGRLSCAACIFGSANQWASLRLIAPGMFQRIADYEQSFGVTIKRNKSVGELADEGTPYSAIDSEQAAAAFGSEYRQPVILDEWQLPAGAFGESTGPT